MPSEKWPGIYGNAAIRECHEQCKNLCIHFFHPFCFLPCGAEQKGEQLNNPSFTVLSWHAQHRHGRRRGSPSDKESQHNRKTIRLKCLTAPFGLSLVSSGSAARRRPGLCQDECPRSDHETGRFTSPRGRPILVPGRFLSGPALSAWKASCPWWASHAFSPVRLHLSAVKLSSRQRDAFATHKQTPAYMNNLKALGQHLRRTKLTKLISEDAFVAHRQLDHVNTQPGRTCMQPSRDPTRVGPERRSLVQVFGRVSRPARSCSGGPST